MKGYFIMKTVFISCRIRGDIKQNIADGRIYYKYAVKQNVAPLMPHIVLADGILNDDILEEREKGIEIAKAIVKKADELWAIIDDEKGMSDGMLAEIIIAEEAGIPIIKLLRSEILGKMN